MRQLFHGAHPPSTPGASAMPMEDVLMTEPGLNSFYDPLETLNRQYPADDIDDTMYEDSQYVQGKKVEPLKKSIIELD